MLEKRNLYIGKISKMSGREMVDKKIIYFSVCIVLVVVLVLLGNYIGGDGFLQIFGIINIVNIKGSCNLDSDSVEVVLYSEDGLTRNVLGNIEVNVYQTQGEFDDLQLESNYIKGDLIYASGKKFTKNIEEGNIHLYEMDKNLEGDIILEVVYSSIFDERVSDIMYIGECS